MKTKIIGIYEFTSKKGANLVNISCLDPRVPTGSLGTCTTNVLMNRENVKVPLDSLVNKNVLIDVNNGFGSSVDEVK